MPNRLLQLLLLATAISGTGALTVALSPSRPVVPVVESAPDTVAPAQRVDTRQPTLLATVTVRPESFIPTLATITVRASRVDVIASEADLAASDPFSTLAGAGAATLYPLPSAAFDMPYYSFGKTLRRVNKE